MNLNEDVKGPFAWVVRIIGWSIAIFIIYGVLSFWATSGAVRHLEYCQVNGPAKAVPVASNDPMIGGMQQLMACVNQRSGPLEKMVFRKTSKIIASLPNAPCQYVGVWTSSRDGASYKIVLSDDSKYSAEPLANAGPRANNFSGSWGVHDKRMLWLDNDRPPFPLDLNAIKDESPGRFSLIEVNGAQTNFVLMQRTPTARCPATS